MALTVGPAEPAKLPRWGSLLAWTALTYVTVGERVTNDGGKIYQCITAGQTAGAGGPTGIGADIPDGAAHWMYVAVNAPAWASGPYTVGSRVTSTGNVYLLLKAGGGNSTVAPTGTSRAPLTLSDGYVWIFIALATASDTEPTEGQKDVGWEPGQMPPAQIQNWNQWTSYRWFIWLKAIGELVLDLVTQLALEGMNWLVTQTFSNGIVVVRTTFGDGATITGLNVVGGDGSPALRVKGGNGLAPGNHAGGSAIIAEAGTSSDSSSVTPAISATAHAAGAAVEATAFSGPALKGFSTSGNGAQLYGNVTKAPLLLTPQTGGGSAPTPEKGAVYYDNTANHYYGCIDGATWTQII